MVMKMIFLKSIIVILATMFCQGDRIILGHPVGLLVWLEKMEITSIGKLFLRLHMGAGEHPLILC